VKWAFAANEQIKRSRLGGQADLPTVSLCRRIMADKVDICESVLPSRLLRYGNPGGAWTTDRFIEAVYRSLAKEKS